MELVKTNRIENNTNSPAKVIECYCSPELRFKVFKSYWDGRDNKPDTNLNACIDILCYFTKMRSKTFKSKSVNEKVEYLNLHYKNVLLAQSVDGILRYYHFTQKNTLISEYLTACNIIHDKGLTLSDPEPPDFSLALQSAKTLMCRHASEDVLLYIASLSVLMPNWRNVALNVLSELENNESISGPMCKNSDNHTPMDLSVSDSSRNVIEPKSMESTPVTQQIAEKHEKCTPEIESLRGQIAVLTKELQKAKEAASYFKNLLRDKKTKQKAELDNTKKRWKTLLTKEKDKNIHLSKLEEQLKTEASEREVIVEKRVQEELSAAMRPWLHEAEMLKKASADRADIKLEKRFKDIYRRQFAFDSKSGSKKRLKNRLSMLESYLLLAKELVHDAVEPLPGWYELISDLEREILHLHTMLGKSIHGNGLTEKLIGLVCKASDYSKLQKTQDLIVSLAENHLLTCKQVNVLNRHIHKIYNRITTIQSSTTEVIFIPSGWNLRPILTKNLKGIVYIDGFNVILSLPDCFERYYDEGKAKTEACKQLIGHVETLATSLSNVTFCIVFDSNDKSTEQILSNLTVEYSGGAGTDRADSVIVLSLAQLDSPEGVFVVTEDRSFRAQVNQLGAIYVPVGIWQELLEDLGVIQKYEEETPAAINIGTESPVKGPETV